jgi:hypothetical protein
LPEALLLTAVTANQSIPQSLLRTPQKHKPLRLRVQTKGKKAKRGPVGTDKLGSKQKRAVTYMDSRRFQVNGDTRKRRAKHLTLLQPPVSNAKNDQSFADLK